MFTELFFAQGEAAEPYLELLSEQGPGELISLILADLDPWVFKTGEISTVLPAGGTDNQYQKGQYILSWNHGLGYVGLTYSHPKTENYD
jgi:hypothetical protein